MRSEPVFRIEIAERGEKCRVWMDDAEISGVLTGVEVVAHVGDRTRVTLSVLPRAVRISGVPAEVTALQALAEAPLQRLREVVRFLDERGGLGQDIHEMLQQTLKETAVP